MHFRVIFVVFTALMLFSCGDQAAESQDNPRVLAARASIEKLEKELTDEVNKDPDSESIDVKKGIFIDSLLAYYRNFPADTLTPTYLDKVHMIYSSQENYRLSAEYAGTIIEKYPNYINRKMILESQITTYDVLMLPRDTVQLKKYIDLYLEESKDLSEDEVDTYNFILKNIGLSFKDRLKAQ